MSEKMFSSDAVKTKGLKEKKEQAPKPFIKKVEARADFVCSCDKEIKKGGECWLVLTQRDIDEQLGTYPDIKPVPSRMCEDCMDKKIVNDKELG
jgi:hypothetical protein